MATDAQEVKIGIEKELTCSICTDIIFQPLTLLDCYHTFCGACLKEWFAFQASTAQSLHPYTCPSCRASVKSTKSNLHFVVSLLDEFYQANPGRRKSEADQAEEKRKYQPGDNVLLKLRKRGSSPDRTEETQLSQNVRNMSLSSETDSTSPQEPRNEESIPAQSPDVVPRRERRVQSRSDSMEAAPDVANTPPRPTARYPPGRQTTLEHQASLRSLLSVSDLRPDDLEGEIMRQIMDEGILDGIDLNDVDLNNIDTISEAQISQTIAQAYRRRQEQRRRERRTRDRGNHTESGVVHGETATATPPQQQIRQQSGSLSAANNTADSDIREPRRNSSNDQASNSLQENTRANTGYIQVPTFSAPTPIRPAVRHLSADNTIVSKGGRPRARSRDDQPTSHQNPIPLIQTSSDLGQGLRTKEGPSPRAVSANRSGAERQAGRSPRARSATAPRSSSSNLVVTTSTSVSTATNIDDRPRYVIIPEPTILCRRCGKDNIQYELHYSCHRCEQGMYSICLRCYRTGKGCLNWYGFGWAAWETYERRAPAGGYPPNHERPHVLTGHRYLPPARRGSNATDTTIEGNDPSKRLESGVFCDICDAFANSCYWKCDTCNDGGWGFCNRCVNQNRHCTHPLLPLIHKRSSPQSPTSEVPPTPMSPTSPDQAHEPMLYPALTPKAASILRGPGVITLANSIFRPLTFSTVCDFCTYPIPPSRTRYHCPKCNDGDYDICTSCYQSLVNRGGIATDSGHHGWRRCIKGHRMVVVGFEDRGSGQRRIVVNDLVGGVTLKEDEAFAVTKAAAIAAANASSSAQGSGASHDQLNWYWSGNDGTVHRQQGGHSRHAFVASSTNLSSSNSNSNNTVLTSPATGQVFPPDGGVGLVGVAQWGYFPEPGVRDELMFPRGAEIREAEDINRDWFWGVYCGAKGLFPGGYVQMIGRTG